MTRWICVMITLSSIFSGLGEGARFSWDRYESRTDDWFKSAAGRQTADNILSHQDVYGGWPKNIDTAAVLFTGDPNALEGTFDNAATTGEMRFLARAYRATEDNRYKDAFIKGLDLILKAQYPTGGWPQCYPPDDGYQHYITFNDGAMVRLMQLLRNIVKDSEYKFVDPQRRTAAQNAFNAGIDCILKCQIRVDGKRTVWCAQHDEVTYEPRKARSYELASLSGGESAGILRLLMDLDDPSPAIIKAITAGAKWYRQVTVKGIKVTKKDGKLMAVTDPDADPLWARFYEIGTNRPLFCNRDGVPRYDYNEIDQERLAGYSWYSDWGEEVLEDFDEWRQTWASRLLPEGTKIMAIIGDSTVCEYPDESDRRGWGQFIQDYFSDEIRVFNRARSGRSTKTFIREGLWDEVLQMEPDYVLIQFGHNDSHAPENPESTDAQTDYKDYLRQYIEQSRAIGAIPVLVTPMYRRKFDDQGNIHDNLLPYAEAMKQVASEEKVPLVDLTTASEKLYLAMGPETVTELANAPDDATHFNEKGARAMARLVMEQLPEVEPSLKPYLAAEASLSGTH